jgi:hypothetical protein
LISKGGGCGEGAPIAFVAMIFEKALHEVYAKNNYYYTHDTRISPSPLIVVASD